MHAIFTSPSERSTVHQNVRQRLLVWATLAMTLAAGSWGVLYFLVGETFAATIPMGYAAISALSLLFLPKFQYYDLLRRSQLVFSLLLPFFLMVALGGWVNSSAVVIWSLISPLSALIYSGTRMASLWFCAFLALVVLGFFVNYPAIAHTNAIPPPLILAFFVLNISGVSVVSFVILRHFVADNERAYGLVQQERQRSEQLIENMLPHSISERLKNNSQSIADRIEGVTILFADIVGFTSYAMTHSPEDVVSMLDTLFSAFDEYAEELGLEKIKTIGDAYMICSGLDGQTRNGAEASAAFALNIIQHVEKIRTEQNIPLNLRIGLHTGTVVAGVIGHKKYSYDIWGDAVNIAARLQQNAAPGKILLSGETSDLLSSNFTLEAQGSIPLKGHTPVDSYRLLYHHSSPRSSGSA